MGHLEMSGEPARPTGPEVFVGGGRVGRMDLTWPLVELTIESDRLTVAPRIVKTFQTRTISRSEIQTVVPRRFGPMGNVEFIDSSGEALPVLFGYWRIARLLVSLQRHGWPVSGTG